MILIALIFDWSGEAEGARTNTSRGWLAVETACSSVISWAESRIVSRLGAAIAARRSVEMIIERTCKEEVAMKPC